MSRPSVEVADIFRQYGPAYRQAHRLPVRQLRVMDAIERCRTAALGGHVEQCGQCSFTRISYNSCRNRHCPKCQSLARARWLEQRKQELLPVEYFHVVFTLPPAAAELALYNPEIVYDILFRTAAETLLTIARDPRHLGADIGFFSILHTWGQQLDFHPHLHCVVAGGGIAVGEDRWIACRPGFFLPVRVLSRLFRRLFVEALEKAFAKGQLLFASHIEPLKEPTAFQSWLDRLRAIEWVVYAKPPFGGPVRVLEYLGRYTHRVAIANQRLMSLRDGKVSFQWKDYRHEHRNKVMTLEAAEFIRRYLLHTLPPGFQRIRHYGLLANQHRRHALEHCRRLLTTPVAELLPNPRRDAAEWYLALTGEPLNRCPQCKTGTLLVIQTLAPCRYPAKPPEDSS